MGRKKREYQYSVFSICCYLFFEKVSHRLPRSAVPSPHILRSFFEVSSGALRDFSKDSRSGFEKSRRNLEGSAAEVRRMSPFATLRVTGEITPKGKMHFSPIWPLYFQKRIKCPKRKDHRFLFEKTTQKITVSPFVADTIRLGGSRGSSG